MKRTPCALTSPLIPGHLPEISADVEEIGSCCQAQDKIIFCMVMLGMVGAQQGQP